MKEKQLPKNVFNFEFTALVMITVVGQCLLVQDVAPSPVTTEVSLEPLVLSEAAFILSLLPLILLNIVIRHFNEYKSDFDLVFRNNQEQICGRLSIMGISFAVIESIFLFGIEFGIAKGAWDLRIASYLLIAVTWFWASELMLNE